MIWLCEHESVYTTGQRRIDNREQPSLPAPLEYVDRGGETTYHGPGQIMLYPVISLRSRKLSVRQYIAMLESSVIALLADDDLMAERRCGLPGVWMPEGKIAAIGIRVKQGVAYHGMALNIRVDQAYFRAINPCGTGLRAVNLEDYLTLNAPIETLAEAWARQFQKMLSI